MRKVLEKNQQLLRGKKLSEEQKIKIRLSNLGLKRSEETKEKIKISHLTES